jgi:hypothetical protein
MCGFLGIPLSVDFLFGLKAQQTSQGASHLSPPLPFFFNTRQLFLFR